MLDRKPWVGCIAIPANRVSHGTKSVAVTAVEAGGTPVLCCHRCGGMFGEGVVGVLENPGPAPAGVI